MTDGKKKKPGKDAVYSFDPSIKLEIVPNVELTVSA